MDWFATKLLAWHDAHGRHDLPWQHDPTPYRVWVSEIMLQQTQVTTVIDYYLRFMQRFGNVEALAAAELDDVLHLWTGLGYYARARNLHKSARIIVDDISTFPEGKLPDTQDKLQELPGIGRSTAGAIIAIAHEKRATILDGNVKRVLTRFHNIAGYPGISTVNKALWSAADTHTPALRTRNYTQAIMDLGATLCTRKDPYCDRCPLQSLCAAYEAGTVNVLPTPKPKKEKPVRRARFFVLAAPNGTALVEQKPTDGLWGGLWTPPQRPSDTTTEAFLHEFEMTRNEIKREHIAPIFRHTFSHYHLDIEPVYLHLEKLPTMIRERDDVRWVSADQHGSNSPVGLSKPAVTLLESLREPFSA